MVLLSPYLRPYLPEGHVRVLLIADDAAPVARILTNEGFAVQVGNLREPRGCLSDLGNYDLLALSLETPNSNGFTVLRAWRLAKEPPPIMILCGSKAVASKIEEFGFGDDEYLTKPFRTDKLRSHLYATVHSHRGHSLTIISGRLTANLDRSKVIVGGQHIRLTTQEHRILELLLLRKGTVVTHQMFLNRLYDGRAEGSSTTVASLVTSVRKKLALAGGTGGSLKTVVGRGYILLDPGDDWGERNNE